MDSLWHQNYYNSNIKDHWSQITVTDIITMKKFEVEELQNVTQRHKSEHVLSEKNGTDLLYRVVANLQIKKKKRQCLEHHKTRYACIFVL